LFIGPWAAATKGNNNVKQMIHKNFFINRHRSATLSIVG
jgi:hypothetical protein